LKCQAKQSIAKREFFGLFWPAFEKAFSKENIESGWRRVGLNPFNPDVVITQIDPAEAEQNESRPSTSDTGSSALSEADSRKVRHLARQVFADAPSVGVRKVVNTTEKLAAERDIVQHENRNLLYHFDEEKKKNQKGMNVIQHLRSEEQTGHLIFSPVKTIRLKEIGAEKAQEKEVKKKKQVDKKVASPLRKQRQEFEREKKAITRKLNKALKERDGLRNELGKDNAAPPQRNNRQPRESSQLGPKLPRSKSKQLTRQETTHIESDGEESLPIPSIRSPRLRRQRRLPKRYDNYEVYME
jgi:hypothetical protein